MKVTIYTAPGCPFCVIVKKYLKRNSIKFSEFDISKDKKKKEEMKQKSHQDNVPVVDVDGTIIIGHNPKSELAKKVGVNLDKGEVIINNHSETNIKGFFAAGDVTNLDWKQAIIGVSQGVTAAY